MSHDDDKSCQENCIAPPISSVVQSPFQIQETAKEERKEISDSLARRLASDSFATPQRHRLVGCRPYLDFFYFL